MNLCRQEVFGITTWLGVKALGVLCKVSVTDDRSKFGPDFDLAITGEPKCVWMSKCESDSAD